MADRWLACLRCGAEFDLGPHFFGCPACASEHKRSPLEVRYDLSVAARALDRSVFDDARGSIWRFHPLLPLRNLANAVTLGEGGTPLVQQSSLSAAAGVAALYLKNESQNPTWSYKDRFNSVAVSVSQELGFDKIASASTGNQGASAAAYATAAGMRCVVLLPDETPDLLGDLIQAYGARAIITRWHARGALLEELVRNHGWFPSSTLAPMPVGTPYGVEGYKTIAFELIQQTRDAPLDYLFVPVGSGDGLYGIYKGWQESVTLGLTDRIPRLVACQSTGANPVVQSVRAGLSEVATVPGAWSIATSTREETAGDYALAAIYGSDGLALDVGDDELRDAMRLLARHGFAPEAASALSVACVMKAAATGLIPESTRAGALLTSTLIKWPLQLAELGERAATIEPSVAELSQVVALE